MNAVSKEKRKTIAISKDVSAGAVLVFAVAIIITVMDKTIKGEKNFVANYDIPILGNIPNFKVAAREENK